MTLLLAWFIPERPLKLGWLLSANACQPPIPASQAVDLPVIVVPVSGGGAASQEISRDAATSLNALRAVYVNEAGKFSLADPNVPQAAFACGVTIGAASIDTAATAKTGGEMTDASWSWTDGPVYIGAGATLTQTPVSSGTLVQIGLATAPTKLIINPQHLVDLAD
jgi:hypothetical protein